MHLYLVRHARPENITDIDPPLGEEGIEEAKILGKFFAALELKPESLKVVSSTAKRAVQTATAICQGMGVADELFTWPTRQEEALGIEVVNSRLLEHLRTITGEEGRSEVIVVGHYPYLSKCLAWLVGNNALSFPGAYGTTVCLACDLTFGQGTGGLNWLVVPALLRCLQKSVRAAGQASGG